MAEGPTPSGAGEPAIRLDGLGKQYPRQSEPAVHDITLQVPTGEIVVLVGPSGCGKTTTLKLINRLIEPTSGRIYLEGQDVTEINADRLRRRIGYVIQQIGLFPHMTIAQNISLTPRLLGWERERVSARVDELLELVGMEPRDYRSRYPKELSGGQRQRVGVARALAADPPVMLMDEPFGAIDPITRERLQDELLGLQAELRKTIVFVTHDIAEAIKMGDRIAIFREGGTIAQYDTPWRILSAPIDRFVEEFVGAGSALRRLGLERVADVEPDDWPLAPLGADLAQLREVTGRAAGRAVLLVDGDRRPRRWVRAGDLEGDHQIGAASLGPPATVGPEQSLQDALDAMLTSAEGLAVVVDGAGAYRGVLDFARVAAALGPGPSR